jgi:heme oxygenase
LGILARVALANAVSERVLELSFAAVQLLIAWQLVRKVGLPSLGSKR